MNQIHGHEVLEMMISSGRLYNRQSLLDEIAGRFGADARFFTCSAQDLSASELVDFLDARGKLVQQEGGFRTSPDLQCGH